MTDRNVCPTKNYHFTKTLNREVSCYINYFSLWAYSLKIFNLLSSPR